MVRKNLRSKDFSRHDDSILYLDNAKLILFRTTQNETRLRCFGILHVPETSNPTTSGGVAGIEYLQKTIKKLSGLKSM